MARGGTTTSIGACDVRIRPRPDGVGVVLQMTMRLDWVEVDSIIRHLQRLRDVSLRDDANGSSR